MTISKLLILIIIIIIIVVFIALIIFKHNINNYNTVESFIPVDIFNVSKIDQIRFATATEGTYPNEYADLFNKIIYPIKRIETGGSIDNINRLEKNECDIALIDEDILNDYINGAKLFGGDTILQNLPHTTIAKTTKNINKILNGVAILYMQYFLFLSANIKTIDELKQLPKKKIGLLNKYSNSHIHFIKICQLNNINVLEDIEIKIYDNQRELFADMRENKIDATYLTTNQKNKDLLELTKDINLYFINPVPSIAAEYPMNEFDYITFIDRNITGINNTAKIPTQKPNTYKIGYITKKPPPSQNSFIEYNNIKNLIDDFVSNVIDLIYIGKENLHRNYIINNIKFKDELLYVSATKNNIEPRKSTEIAADLRKRLFPHSYKYLLNLRAFYKFANKDDNLETYGTRMALVCRYDIDEAIIGRIIDNMIEKNDKFKENINNYMANNKLYTYIDTFKINEFCSFNVLIDLHEGLREKYVNIGLLKYESVISCDN